MKNLITVDELRSIKSVSDEVIRECIEKELSCHLSVVAVEEDVEFYQGGEYLCRPSRSIGKLIYGSMHNFYVTSNADIPDNHRIVLSSDSPHTKLLNDYQKEEAYELSVLGCFPDYIREHLRGEGFTYWYKDDIIHTYVRKGFDTPITDGILELYSLRDNALGLFSFELAEPWYRSTRSSSSDYSGEVGIGSWSDKGYF